MIDTGISLEKLNDIRTGTLVENLGIEVTAVAEDGLTGTMPVDERTFQPFGLLHGGATAALIETLGSLGSSLLIDHDSQASVGLELNVNHLRAVRNGTVTCRVRAVHAGRRTHVWQADVMDEEGRAVATGRLTTMVIAKG